MLGGCGSEGALQARHERTASRAGVLETVGDESVRERRVADLVLGELGERAGDGRIRGGVCVWAASSAADVCPMQPLDEGAMNELGQRGALEGTAHVERAWAEALAGIGARAAEADLGVCRLIGEGSIRFCDQRGGRGVLQLSRRQTTSIEAMLRSPEFVRFAGLSRESACGVRGPYARPLVRFGLRRWRKRGPLASFSPRSSAPSKAGVTAIMSPCFRVLGCSPSATSRDSFETVVLDSPSTPLEVRAMTKDASRAPVHEKDRSQQRRQRVFKGVAAAMVVCAMPVIGEAFLRLAAPQPASWFDVYRRHPTLPFYALQADVDQTIDTGETRWRLLTDGDGFRVSAPPEQRSRQAPARLGLVLGDSFAFAQGVDYEQGFVHRLERATPWRFRNASVPGYGPVQYRQLLSQALEQGERPAFILVSTFLGNDLHDCIWNKDIPVHDGVIGDRGDFKSRLKRSSHLYRLFAKAYHVVAPPPPVAGGAPLDAYAPASYQPGGEMHRASALYRREMTTIAELARKHAIPLLVVVIPAPESVKAARGELPKSGNDYDLPRAFATSCLEALEIPFVDLTKVFERHPTDSVYFSHDGHLTPFGNQLVASALTPKLPVATPREEPLDPGARAGPPL